MGPPVAAMVRATVGLLDALGPCGWTASGEFGCEFGCEFGIADHSHLPEQGEFTGPGGTPVPFGREGECSAGRPGSGQLPGRDRDGGVEREDRGWRRSGRWPGPLSPAPPGFSRSADGRSRGRAGGLAHGQAS